MKTKKAYLYFPEDKTDAPFICTLIKNYNLTINIFRAKVTQGKEGYVSLEIAGEDKDINAGFEYLKDNGVTICSGDVGLIWDEEKCTHCTNCTVHCPTMALHVADFKTRQVAFDEAKCVECLACIEHCPYSVCSSIF